jgi:hypothetical protein
MKSIIPYKKEINGVEVIFTIKLDIDVKDNWSNTELKSHEVLSAKNTDGDKVCVDAPELTDDELIKLFNSCGHKRINK